jgi:hypothetical protein
MRSALFGGMLLLIAADARAIGPLSIGVRGGVPILDAFKVASSGNLSYSAVNKRYVVGPGVEIRLPFKTSITLDALYRKLEYSATEQAGAGSVARAVTASEWGFPLMLKHRFGGELAQPYLAAGFAFNHLTGVKQVVTCVAQLNCLGSGAPSELRGTNGGGITFGAGIEVGLPLIRVTPEIRYTRRSNEFFREPGRGLLRSSRNQIDAMIGIHF